MRHGHPTWEQVMKSKHETQIAAHEARFGKLGELQSPEEKSALAQSVSAIKKDTKNARGSNN